MKRFLALALSIVMVLSVCLLAGCSGNNETTDTSKKPETSATSDTTANQGGEQGGTTSANQGGTTETTTESTTTATEDTTMDLYMNGAAWKDVSFRLYKGTCAGTAQEHV